MLTPYFIFLALVTIGSWKYLRRRFSKKIIFLIVLVFLFIGIIELSHLHPSDEKMISDFEKNASTFEMLHSMITEDCDKGLKRIGVNFTRPENFTSLGINENRINTHKKLMHDLDIEMGWECHYSDILFYASTAGLSISGSVKGYLYSKSVPQNYFKEYQGQSRSPVENLDSYKPLNPHSFTIYRHIKDNWYLFYDYED